MQCTCALHELPLSRACAAAFDYMKSNPIGKLDLSAFEQSCGVGVVVTQEDINREVRWLHVCCMCMSH